VVLDFAHRWKPHTAVHLGDAFDLSAFMKNGTAHEREGISDDIAAGEEFLTAYYDTP
jgi:hypothetical protein